MNVALRPEHLNIISLCTGGGGLDLGVDLAMPSARSVVLVEREAFAASHLVSAIQKGLMAPAAIWSDVTTFNGRPWRGLVDGLIGGIPCQPHSLAGKRLGEDDERDLWSDARRIIVQSGAWFVLIENVRGMVSSGGAERVWRDLRRLGFAVEAGLFTAAEVGASHERERIFILAVADRYHQYGDWVGIQRAGWRGQPADGRGELADAFGERGRGWDNGRQDAADADASSQRDGGALVHAERPKWRANTERRHELDGNNSRRDQAPSGAGEPSEMVADADIIKLRREPPARKQPLLQPDDGISQTYLFPPGPSDLDRWQAVLERAPELEPAFRRVANGLASRLDIARVDRLRLLGNGVVSLEAAYAFRTLVTRLAASGSAGAARIIRMMGSAHTPHKLSSPDKDAL